MPGIQVVIEIVILLALHVQAFPATRTAVSANSNFKAGYESGIFSDSKICLEFKSRRKLVFDDRVPSRRRPCKQCPGDIDEEDGDIDRRESFFAMVGGVLASLSMPSAVSAMYGEDAKIELPNPVDAITKRANGQCLVETLGNRECLVYLDPANKLYQGVDSEVLFTRIAKDSDVLASIPTLVTEKKWTQVTGTLLGPLGDLVETMNQLTRQSKNTSKASVLAKKTKVALYEIFQAAERKQVDKALVAHKEATTDLSDFLKAL
jgi:hypothetical protein